MKRTRVLIAGAGVAGLEAALALHDLAADRVDLTLLAPTERFVYRPLLVAAPFGLVGPTDIDLAPIVEETGARHIRDSLASVDPRDRTAATASGPTLPYDVLLVAAGARPVDAVPGALTFAGDEQRERFGGLLGELGRRGVKRLAFVVPPRVTWAIAAYELALLTAGERDVRRLSGVELLLVTHESAPLEVFGAPATQLVAARLREANVGLRLSSVAESFEGSELRFSGGDSVSTDRVVALPELEVPKLPGLPQRGGGFVATDVQMHVMGLERVWAAGDVTSFPVKQGGLAAQQADVAARSIAAHAGAHVPVHPFQPVLRAALITGGTPEYMRSPMYRGAATEATVGRALWSPPEKLAGNYIAPYLSRLAVGDRAPDELADLPADADADQDQGEHEKAMALVLAAADADADAGDFEGALRWLSLAERLEFVLPQEYVPRRHVWLHELDPTVEPSAAAGRMEPTLIDAAAALSDLQRRIGWLREVEARRGEEMRADLSHLEQGLQQLIALSRRTRNLPRPDGRRSSTGPGRDSDSGEAGPKERG
jgi:sulfide:quinone oxidoreductase